MSRLIKDALLEKYLAQALSPDAAAALEKTLADSPGDQARLQELQAESQAFLIQHPPGAFAARLGEPQQRPWWRQAFLWGPLAAAAVALLLVLQAPRTVEPDESLKGTLALRVHRKTPDGSEILGPGAEVHAGDTLRFQVTVPAEGYVVVVGVDGASVVSVLTPQGTTSALRVKGAVLLDDAVELDATAGDERFVLVWRATAFDAGAVRTALEKAEPVETSLPGARVMEVRFPKQSP